MHIGLEIIRVKSAAGEAVPIQHEPQLHAKTNSVIQGAKQPGQQENRGWF